MWNIPMVDLQTENELYFSLISCLNLFIISGKRLYTYPIGIPTMLHKIHFERYTFWKYLLKDMQKTKYCMNIEMIRQNPLKFKITFRSVLFLLKYWINVLYGNNYICLLLLFEIAFHWYVICFQYLL